MESVGIVGVGLIGGSFGLALRKAGFTGEILGVSSARSIEQAVERRAIDRGATLEEAAGTCDLLFLAQPIFGIIETLRKLDPLVRPETLVTDAGSTKQSIVEEARRSLRRCAFIGGHPMAGKEQRGVAAAEADLFRGRPWVLTSPIDHEFRKWIAAFGAREIILDAGQHDRLVAWSSHLPQLASTALASAIGAAAPEAGAVAGPGLLDSTRLAMSAYDLWRDILETNSAEVSAALDAYIAKLQTLRADFETEFRKGAEFARSIRK
ncbi:MAG TPA: prephenate dehydrogenase/arogenate dehydrogenase family protein [Bryobacteraceae bacterium]|jgi:prephenate dehydrogenase|nr:prephenate dehydrogenase/arogenate dehydrogenase family protein [Bryobacteraceae bacterium]